MIVMDSPFGTVKQDPSLQVVLQTWCLFTAIERQLSQMATIKKTQEACHHGIPVTSALGKLKQEDPKFESSQSDTVS